MLDGLFFGTTFQCKRARRRRPRGAVREQEDEDAQGHGARQPGESGCPGGAPGSLFASSAVHVRSCAGCAGSFRGGRRGAERGEGCEGLDGGPDRP